MPEDILVKIADRTRGRLDEKKKTLPLTEIRRQAEERMKAEDEATLSKDVVLPENTGKQAASNGKKKSFYEALKNPSSSPLAYICEVKKASPSKGVIAEGFPYLSIAKEYEAAGADAISCLTEPYFFLGSDEYLKEISRAVSIPVLRKDFTVDEYMVYEAKAYGAKALLLICSILDDGALKAYYDLARELSLDALVEAHDEREIERALKIGARIIGVNNRNLRNFSVDSTNALGLRKNVPEDVLFVSESGMKSREDILAQEKAGVNAVLIGETLMRSPEKRRTLEELKGM